MNFGFFGDEADLQLVQSAMGASSTHRLTAVVVADSPVRLPLASARQLPEFDELLADAHVDAVILGGPVSERAGRADQLLRVGRHCLCLHPAAISPLSYHELGMIAADQRVVLVPWLPGRLHPAWIEFVRLCKSERVGPLKFITVERAGSFPADRLLLAGSYAEAIDLLRPLVGEISEVSVTGELSSGRLIAHHRTTGGTGVEVRLQSSAASIDSWKITAEAERARVELILEQGLGGPATLRRSDSVGVQETSHAAAHLGAMVLDEMDSAVRGRSHTLTWSDATRAAELADWAWYSLERRRAVDVFHEERGELASFKGRMTSVGCGLIWFTLFMLIIIAAGKGLQMPGTDWLAGALAAVWVLFLLFQTLRWAMPKD